jgi:hypothetical protein
MRVIEVVDWSHGWRPSSERTDDIHEHAAKPRGGHAGHERGEEEAERVEGEDDADDGRVRVQVLLGKVREEGDHGGCRACGCMCVCVVM